jgi:hypothetical protein
VNAWPLEDEPWRATIERTGRLWWHVRLHRGLMELSSGWFVFGSEHRAEKLARRKIRKWNRKDDLWRARRVIS